MASSISLSIIAILANQGGSDDSYDNYRLTKIVPFRKEQVSSTVYWQFHSADLKFSDKNANV